VTKISSIQGCGLWSVQSCNYYMTLTAYNMHDFLKKARSTSYCILYIHWKKCV